MVGITTRSRGGNDLGSCPLAMDRPHSFEIGCSLFVLRAWRVRNHFKHSIELVDREGDIVDVLAAVEDFLLAQATYEAAKQRWPKERIRLSQQARILEDSTRRRGDR